jgi:hypothetical protein
MKNQKYMQTPELKSVFLKVTLIINYWNIASLQWLINIIIELIIKDNNDNLLISCNIIFRQQMLLLLCFDQ